MASDPWAKFRQSAPASPSKEDPWSKYRAPKMMQNTNREDWATLPEPHEGMFSDMEDADAKIYHDAYARHPDTQKDEQGNLIYKGKVVPPAEGNSPAAESLTNSWLTNPLGKGLAWAFDDPTIEGNAAAFNGGVLSTLENAATLGGALYDKIEFGGNHPASNHPSTKPQEPLMNNAPTARAIDDAIPTFNPDSSKDGDNWIGQHGSKMTGNIASSLVLGNKIAAWSKTAGLAPATAKALSQYIPEMTAKIAAALAVRMPIQAVGVGIGSPSGSSTAVTGPNAGLSIISGLETKSKDEAQNIINDRLNIAADAFLTALPIEGIGNLGKLGFNKLLGERILEPMKMLLPESMSGNARKKNVISEVIHELGYVTGKESPEQLDQVRTRIGTLIADKEANTIKATHGIEGVESKDIPLDTTTTINRALSGSRDPEDIGISEYFKGKRNKIIQEGGLKTERASNRVGNALYNTLEDTKKVFDEGSVAKGLDLVHSEADRQVAGHKQAGAAAEMERLKLGKQISEDTADSMEKRRLEKNSEFQKIIDLNPAAPADSNSFNSVYKQSKPFVPDEIKKLIEDSDGTFGYLYNKVRPQLSEAISDAYDTGRATAAKSLRKLRDNIDEDQINYLKSKRSTSGKFKTVDDAVADQAEKAMENYKTRYANFKQGPTGDLDKIARVKRLQDNERVVDSRAVVDSTVAKKTSEPEHYKSLEQLLTEEGKSSENLLKYADAKRLEKDSAEAERRVFDKYKHLFKDRGIKTENASESFDKLLQDLESGSVIKEMRGMKEPDVDRALKSAWARRLQKSLFKGQYTKDGTPKLSLSSEDRDKLFEYGDEIFSDNPDFTNLIKDLVVTGTDVVRSGTFKSAESGITSKGEKAVKEAGVKAITLKEGRLSKKASKYNVLYDIIVKIPHINRSLKNILDGGLADTGDMTKLLDYWETEEQKAPGSKLREITRFLTQGSKSGDSDDNKFREEYQKLNPDMDVEREFPKRKSWLRKQADPYIEPIEELGSAAKAQTKKLFYGDSKNPK